MAETRYVWDYASDAYLMEKDEAGATTAVYANEPVQYGNLVSQRRGGVTNYYHFDGQGSTRELTDAAGATSDIASYTAYGEPVDASGATTNPFRYVGAFGYHADESIQTWFPGRGHRAVDIATRCNQFLGGDSMTLLIDAFTTPMTRCKTDAYCKCICDSHGRLHLPAPGGGVYNAVIDVCLRSTTNCCELIECVTGAMLTLWHASKWLYGPGTTCDDGALRDGIVPGFPPLVDYRTGLDRTHELLLLLARCGSTVERPPQPEPYLYPFPITIPQPYPVVIPRGWPVGRPPPYQPAPTTQWRPVPPRPVVGDPRGPGVRQGPGVVPVIVGVVIVGVLIVTPWPDEWAAAALCARHCASPAMGF